MTDERWRRLFISLFAFFITLFAGPQMSWAEDTIRVAICPFEIHSKSNADYLRETIYSRLAKELQEEKDIKLLDKDAVARSIQDKPLNETTAIAAGKEVGADYMLMGSLTQIGEQISVDVKLIDIARGGHLAGIFVEGKGSDNIARRQPSSNPP
jgi:outer membrane protein insertion porin family